MASDKFTVTKQGDVFRIVRGGEPQSTLDEGGFTDRQSALDAAAAANLELDRTPTGPGMGKSRKGRMDAIIKAMGG